jgi:LacI family transcriptional regulator
MAGVTLRQIAELAGCSRSTVSYALNNNPNISPETRDRVLKAAEQLGWRPDAELARQMALVRGSVIKTDLPKIAIVLKKPREMLANEATPRLQLIGARDYADRMGYSPDIFNLAEEPLTARRLREILVARGVQGIVFIATVNPQLPEEYFEIGSDFACAIAGVRYPNLPFHVVINDFLSTGRTSVLEVLKAGSRRPVAILPRGLDRTLGYGYTGGLSTGLIDVPVANRLPILYAGEGNSIPEEDFKWLKPWIRENRPDAVLSTDVAGGRKLLGEMREREGLEIPFFSLDWSPGQDADGGIDSRQHEVGRAAVDVVVAQLHRGESGIPDVQRVIQIEGVWRDAAHVAAARQAP